MSIYEYDPDSGIAALRAADPKLGRLIRRVGPYELGVRAPLSTFQELMRAIVYQQLSGRAAATIFRRVCELFPGKRAPGVDDIVRVTPAALRAAGMSHAKIAAVKDLAAKTKNRAVPGIRRLRNMPDDEIIQRLTEVRGIGPWTVEMFLMFKLGRGDVLPATDLGVRKGFEILYARKSTPPPRVILEHGERWRPYRTIASWYLWRAVEL